MAKAGPITVVQRRSTLRLGVDRTLPVRILQCETGAEPLRARDATGEARSPAGSKDRPDADALLRDAVDGGLTAIGWHQGLRDLDWGDLGTKTVAAGLGHLPPSTDEDGTETGTPDLIRVVGPGEHIEIAKTCRSSMDEEDLVIVGDEVVVFVRPMKDDAPDPDYVTWAVLNCFEYTHPQIIEELEKLEVEVLVVLSANPAGRMYWENALADTHRLFAYIVHANIAEYGRSAIFAPVRRLGDKNVGRLTVGGYQLASRGTGRVTLDSALSIGMLRDAKKELARDGFDLIDDDPDAARNRDLMVPSQHYMRTYDKPAGNVKAAVEEPIPFDWHRGRVVTLGVAQLYSAPEAEYRACGYRLVGSDHFRDLAHKLDIWLRHAADARSPSGRPIEMLLLPEVFVPRELAGTLQAFARRHDCTVVAGLDYPEGVNANECQIFPRRGGEGWTYRKITRSQYDARGPKVTGRPDHARLNMERGSSLLRFTSSEGRSFGVLICYDFSHVGLMSTLNLERRHEPLDLVTVIAHNPFGELYRSGCVSDAHRFYQYVAMCNVATYGGSGIFAPMRRSGPRQVLAEVGAGTEAIAVADLDLDLLAAARVPEAPARAAALDDAARQRQATGAAKPTDFMRPSAVTQRSVTSVVTAESGSPA